MTLKYGIAFVVLSLTLTTVAHDALAVTAELAKKCQGLTAKAFPSRLPGNPAAGLMHGTAREASAYFKKCLDNNGNVEATDKDQAPQGTK